jgi:hypothetical protein
MTDRFVPAIGDNGCFESVRESETVSIPFIPVGADNMIVPATLRALQRAPGEGQPTRLIRILRASTRLNPRPYARVEFECTPFERYRDRGKVVLGHESSCFVRGERDARDPLFDSLTVRDRFRILKAVAPGWRP